MLTFDEASHTYRWNGNVVPSVTGIIAPLEGAWLAKIAPDVLEHARQEGVAMHKMVELDCKNELDVESLPEWLKPRYAAWRKFVSETGFELWASEQKLYNRTYGYAGTLDLAGVLTKIKQKHKESLIDVKRTLTGAPAVGVQLAGYLDTWNRGASPNSRRITRRFALELRANGEYRLQEYADREDIGCFLACLTLKRWREKNR
jgi:hypothetical protein